jgi:hypothetical protein
VIERGQTVGLLEVMKTFTRSRVALGLAPLFAAGPSGL